MCIRNCCFRGSIWLFVAMLMFSKSSFAQEVLSISGKVTDKSDGSGLPGVSIKVKSGNISSVTNVKGEFNLKGVENNATLVFSYIGYITQEVQLNGRSSINVALAADSKNIDEVVVTGYGTTTRRNLTTSIAKVNPADVPGAANSSVNQLLVGRAAGLQVTQQSAEPGGGIDLAIRGRGTPLIVIDGVVVPSNSLEAQPGGVNLDLNGVRRGGINNINPADIESIEILKDASAAIYGVAAADGVILITTKKGKVGRMNISYSGNHSVIKNWDYLEPLSPADYMTYFNIFSKDVYDKSPTFSATDIQNAGSGTDWLGQVLRTGSLDNHGFNINGGNDKILYYFSANYFNQVGTMRNSDMTKYSGKLNLSYQMNKVLKLSTNVDATRSKYTNSTAGWQNGGSGTQGFGALQAAISYPTYLPIRDANGKYTQFVGTGNPVAMLDMDDKTSTPTIFSTFSLDAEIIPRVLSAKLLYGNNYETSSRNFYIPSDLFFGAIYQSRGYLSSIERQSQTMEGTISYKKKFNDIVDLNAVAGYGQYTVDRFSNGMIATDMLDATGTSNMGAAPTRATMTSDKYYNKRRSYFTRANIGIVDRYLLSLVWRYDGDDKFFPSQKYKSFPSISAGWKISEESFMKPIQFIDHLKLRASWGITGTPPQENALAYAQYVASGDQAYFSNGTTVYSPYYQTSNDLPKLKWAETINKNIGLDFELFKSKFSGSFDLFKDEIKDLLIRKSTDQLAYVATTYDNGGSQIRSGAEFSFKAKYISTKKFKWDMTGNVTSYKFRWDTRYNNADLLPYIGIKDEVNAVYVFPTNGILKTGETPAAFQPANAKMAGAPKFVDGNGDGVIDYKDVVKHNRDPKVIYGLGNNFKYKQFDLSAFFYAQFGAKDYNRNLQWTSARELGGGSMGATVEIKDVWSTANENGTLPGGKFVSTALGLPNGTELDTYLESKDFIRCRNITLGYTLAKPSLSKYFSNLRLFMDVQNPFIITNYSIGDPELRSVGTKGAPAPYPMATTYSLGLNVNF